MVMHNAGEEFRRRFDGRCLFPRFDVRPLALHRVKAKCRATIDSVGVSLLGGRVTLARGVSRSYANAARVKPDWVIAAPV